MDKPRQKREHKAQPGSTRAAAATHAAVPDRIVREVSETDIRLCAYRKWESAGKPAGDGVQFWLDAENELRCGK